MRYRLTRHQAIIRHHAESIRKTFLRCQFLDHEKYVSDECFIFIGKGINGCDLFFRDHENMRRRLRGNVAKCETDLIFKHDVCRNFTIDDLFENGHEKTCVPFQKQKNEL